MRIDAHGHACGYYNTIDLIKSEMLRNKLDKIILFPGEKDKKIDLLKDRKNKEILYTTNIIGELLGRFFSFDKIINQRNHDVFEMSKELPNNIIQFYWLTPRFLSAIQVDYKSMQFKGIKLHQCIKYFKINSKFFNYILDFAEEHKLPIIIHLRGKKDVTELIKIIKNRNIRIIVAHLFYIDIFKKYWDGISNKIWFDMANYYFLNISTIELAINYFGSEKIIFGSDNPFGEDCINKTIKIVENLSIDNYEKNNILGNNIDNLMKEYV